MKDYFGHEIVKGDLVHLLDLITCNINFDETYTVHEIAEELMTIELFDKSGKKIIARPEILVHATTLIVSNDDSVDHPSHYTYGNIETIDVIREWLGPEKFVAYLNGNIIKYISRWEHKNGVEDLKKAKWYLEKIIEELK